MNYIVKFGSVFVTSYRLADGDVVGVDYEWSRKKAKLFDNEETAREAADKLNKIFQHSKVRHCVISK